MFDELGKNVESAFLFLLRLEKECRVFFQQPIDGLVFVLPREMSDVDGSLLASAAHPEIVQSAKWRAPESGRLQTHSSINSCTSIGTPSSKHRGSGDVLTAVRGANSSPPSALLSGFENGALEYSMSFPGGLQWLIAVRCAAGSIYEGSVFLLRLRFTARYPIGQSLNSLTCTSVSALKCLHIFTDT